VEASNLPSGNWIKKRAAPVLRGKKAGFSEWRQPRWKTDAFLMNKSSKFRLGRLDAKLEE